MFSDNDLNEQELAALAALPREMAPSAQLEQRVFRELRKEGHFGGRRNARFSMDVMFRVAAAIALFAGGVATGRYMITQSRLETASAQETIRRANESVESPSGQTQQVKNAETVVAEREMWL